MDRELIDHVWKYCLPKEFKEEVKEIYLNAVVHHPCGYNHKTDLMKYLFGRNNLTSDVEGEEILTCEKSKVQRAYNTSREIVKAENPDSLMYSMHTQIMYVLENIFGSKCLSDEDSGSTEDALQSKCRFFIDGKCKHPVICAGCDSSDSAEAEYRPKTAEPKFKIGDKVRVKFNAKELHSNPDPSKNIYYWQTARDKYLGKVFKITDIWKSGTITLNTAEVMFWEPFDLEPYTEPKNEGMSQEQCVPKNAESGTHSFNHILKDGFRKERRLNIAAQIVASMIGSDDWTTWRGGSNKEIWHNMAKSSLEIADALIAEAS